jgi:hypothetical protein
MGVVMASTMMMMKTVALMVMKRFKLMGVEESEKPENLWTAVTMGTSIGMVRSLLFSVAPTLHMAFAGAGDYVVGYWVYDYSGNISVEYGCKALDHPGKWRQQMGDAAVETGPTVVGC